MSARPFAWAVAAVVVGCGGAGTDAAAPGAAPPGGGSGAVPTTPTTPSADTTAPTPPVAASASASSSAGASAPAPDQPPAAPPKPQNVLMILVDSMRADMPWAGYPRDIMPRLTALEKESVSYTRGYSVSSYTAKSVAAALSGQYPSTLRRSGYFFAKYPPSNVFLAEALQAAGVHTLSTHGHMYMAPGRNGMDQGFVDWQVVSGIDFDSKTDNHVTSQKLTPLAIEQLGKVPAGKPFFAYLHYMDPHDVYVKHPEGPQFGTKARDRYDGELFYTDQWVGKLLDWCAAQPWWGETVVIVSADHGEAFGEHKLYRHAFEVYDVLVRVPLFFRLPGVAGRRIDVPRSGIDLAPTIAELLQVEAAKEVQGKSLVPELRGGTPEPRPVLIDLPADSNNDERRAFVDGNLKLMIFGNDVRFELYDVVADPGETRNLWKKGAPESEGILQRYREVWQALPRVKPFGGNKLINGQTASGPS